MVIIGLQGAIIILISRGGVTSLSLGEEQEVLQLSLQHNLQIFSIALPQPPLVDISLSLERIAHATGIHKALHCSHTQLNMLYSKADQAG